MKFLLLLLVIVGGIYWIRLQRMRESDSSSAPQSSAESAQWMIECPVCGTHLPQSDAVQGQRHLYCSVAHRQQAEG